MPSVAQSKELMENKLYVGNLAYSTRAEDLKLHFSAYGHVVSAQVIMERDSDRSKGFGFVEMDSEQEAHASIEGLNGKDIDGRALSVSLARPMAPRSGSHSNR